MRKAKSNLKFLKSEMEEKRGIHYSSSKGQKSKKQWRKQKNHRIDNRGYEIQSQSKKLEQVGA